LPACSAFSVPRSAWKIETSTERLIFGYFESHDGMPLVPVAIGMLALSKMMVQIRQPPKAGGGDRPAARVRQAGGCGGYLE